MIWTDCDTRTNHNWRYHKDLKMWLTKDPTAPEPVTLVQGESERGTYIFFDFTRWERQRHEYILHYDHLDTHIAVRQNGAATG